MNPLMRERLLKVKARVEQGRSLKRKADEELSDSMGKFSLSEEAFLKPVLNECVFKNSPLQLDTTSAVTSVPDDSTTGGKNKEAAALPNFEEEMAHSKNAKRLQGVWWTSKSQYDPFQDGLYHEAMDASDQKAAMRDANVKVVEDHYALCWRNHHKQQLRGTPGNEVPVPHRFVIERAREHLRIADLYSVDPYYPRNLTDEEHAVWNEEVANWPSNRHIVYSQSLVRGHAEPIPYERPAGMEEDDNMEDELSMVPVETPGESSTAGAQREETAHRVKRAYTKKAMLVVEKPWDCATDNCHWDGATKREDSPTKAMAWFEIDNSNFPPIVPPAKKPNYAKESNAILRAVLINVMRGDFGAESSPFRGVVVPGDEEKDQNMRRGMFPPPNSLAFFGPRPEIGCMPIHDRYAYWIVWLQANGYSANHFYWLVGQDCERLRISTGMKTIKRDKNGNEKEDSFATTLWMRASRLRTRYSRPENQDGVQKSLTRGKAKKPTKKTKGAKAKNKKKGKALAEANDEDSQGSDADDGVTADEAEEEVKAEEEAVKGPLTRGMAKKLLQEAKGVYTKDRKGSSVAKLDAEDIQQTDTNNGETGDEGKLLNKAQEDEEGEDDEEL